MTLADTYTLVRKHTNTICAPLKTEDYGVQPTDEVSPPKWHIAHTTWFFETFLLKPKLTGYKEYDPSYAYLFNSYYQSLGERNPRMNRGLLSRPPVAEIFEYRDHVDRAMERLMATPMLSPEIQSLVTIGMQHEQQHQELLLTDIKAILSMNLLPPAVHDLYETKSFVVHDQDSAPAVDRQTSQWLPVKEGLYEIGHSGEGFHWDNELGRHQVYLCAFEISDRLVTNAEYLEFMAEGGYERFDLWHDEGWAWVGAQQIQSPLYWFKKEDKWFIHTLLGPVPLPLRAPVTHLSFYEAYAYASWKGSRLPTEFEWEAASPQFTWGARWEWTYSAYLPYPGYQKAEGALGEYNGKFMINQMVLRGSSVATPLNHSRKTYRNFFHPQYRWQFTGLRLVK